MIRTTFIGFMISLLLLPGCATTNRARGAIHTEAAEPPAGHEKYQRYWNGVRAADYSGGGSKICTAEMRAALARDYAGLNRPEMMAFGDSLYNGVQSLRINWWLSEWSTPSLIAIRLGFIQERAADRTGNRSFYGPQYPSSGSLPGETIDYGFNLEKLPNGVVLSRLAGLAHMMKRQGELLEDLAERYRPPNGRPMVENISFSGANSTDLTGWTAAEFRRQGGIARDAMKASFPPDFGQLGDAFTFSNAAFVLSPMRNPCVENMTPLDQIVFRQPKRLFINLGANNGIFRAAFSGEPVTAATCAPKGEPADANGRTRCDGTIREFLTKRLISDLRRAGERLIAEPGVEVVYINGVGRPSRPANVVLTRGRNGVAYSTAFFARKKIASNEMQAADDAADLANAHLKALVQELNELSRARGQGPRFVFVDMDAAFAAKDYKRCLTEKSAADCHDKRLLIDDKLGLPKGTSQWVDNRPMRAVGTDGLTVGSDFDPKVKEGGIFSFDNMHLSSMGYELMAEAVRLKLDEHDPGLQAATTSCPDRVLPGMDVEIGACRRFMVEPGWSYADDTRRAFIFQRIAGERAMHNKGFVRAMAEFVDAITK